MLTGGLPATSESSPKNTHHPILWFKSFWVQRPAPTGEFKSSFEGFHQGNNGNGNETPVERRQFSLDGRGRWQYRVYKCIQNKIS